MRMCISTHSTCSYDLQLTQAHSTMHCIPLVTIGVCNCHRVSTTANSEYDAGNQRWTCLQRYIYIGCVNSVVNHNFTLIIIIAVTCYAVFTQPTYMSFWKGFLLNIFTTDYQHHIAKMVILPDGGSGNTMAVKLLSGGINNILVEC